MGLLNSRDLPSDDQLRAVLGNSGPGWSVPPPRSRAELDAVMQQHGYDDGHCAAGCRMPCGCRWRVGTCGPFVAAFHALAHLDAQERHDAERYGR